ncbi:MAG: endolytic transglycosylase MltG [Candidatus Amulumruptor caecigallinarius]|nr:endolytic transglycosylase MltG [Candidatus Amulumruptor caecigallinarius]
MRETRMAASTHTKKPGRSGKEQRAGRKLQIFLPVLTIFIVLGLVCLYPVMIPGAPRYAVIKVPEGATLEMLGDSLTRHFGKTYSNRVMWLVKLRGTNPLNRHGAYAINKGANALAAMRKLTSGAQTPVKITINGFRDINLMKKKIAAKLEFTPEALDSALNNADLLRHYGLTPENAMALFIDDTYEVFWTTTPEQLLGKIGDNYMKVWNPENTRKAAQLGMTPAEITVIASIADEETNDIAEKGTVGRLYINRLKKGIRLQADPTVKFAAGDFSIRRITGKHLKTDSPYNTYLNAGLPPGPIRTTSAATINAILNAPASDYLYMCAKEDFSGKHNFTDKYEEHLKNAARYQEALNRAGIK